MKKEDFTISFSVDQSPQQAFDAINNVFSEQNSHQWSLPLIEEAERLLAEASNRGRTGRFQLEAAIQSVHAERARSGRTQWVAIVLFYEQLVRMSPTLGTRTGYAAAVAEAVGPEAGLAVLDGLDPEAVSAYQPYWRLALTCCNDWGRHLRPSTLSTVRLV